MRGNKQKSTPDQLLPGPTRTTSDAIACGHLATDGLQGSADLVEKAGQATAKLLEQCKTKLGLPLKIEKL